MNPDRFERNILIATCLSSLTYALAKSLKLQSLEPASMFDPAWLQRSALFVAPASKLDAQARSGTFGPRNSTVQSDSVGFAPTCPDSAGLTRFPHFCFLLSALALRPMSKIIPDGMNPSARTAWPFGPGRPSGQSRTGI
jgi:hypothetical protein